MSEEQRAGNGERGTGRRRLRRGFTLLEILLAITILSLISTVMYVSFAAVTDAWKRGMDMTETLHHGDFVIEQLAIALRSAYYPETRDGTAKYGFWQTDNGDSESDADVISWVKLGSALVGREVRYAGSPHRVRLTIEEDEEGLPAVSVRSWRVKGQDEDFDPDELEPVFLSNRIRGMNCRTSWQRVDGELEWLDEWEETNRIPRMVEITLYLEPLDKGEPSVEIKRLVSLPAAELSWQVRRRDAEQAEERSLERELRNGATDGRRQSEIDRRRNLESRVPGSGGQDTGIRTPVGRGTNRLQRVGGNRRFPTP